MFVYVETSLPRTLQIDRSLHHRFWKVPRLGDQALEEEWNIFVRKGRVWITIQLVRTEAWPAYRKPLERAAAEQRATALGNRREKIGEKGVGHVAV